MSDHQIGIQETEDIPLPPHPPHHSGNHYESENRFVRFCKRSLDQGDEVIYAIVGICFFLGAFFALGYSFWDFSVGITPVFTLNARPADVAKTIIQLVSDLLLVLIIMEVLGTVIHYLKAHATSLRPFLFIGIVSATRGILSIGARLSVGEVKPSDFANAMIELGVSAAVILALGITLKLLGKLVGD